MKLIYWRKSLCFCDLESSKAGASLRFCIFPSVLCCPPIRLVYHQHVAGLTHTCCSFYSELALFGPTLTVWLHSGSAAFKPALPFKNVEVRAKRHMFITETQTWPMTLIKGLTALGKCWHPSIVHNKCNMYCFTWDKLEGGHLFTRVMMKSPSPKCLLHFFLPLFLHITPSVAFHWHPGG